jgi:hypothetical protein
MFRSRDKDDPCVIRLKPGLQADVPMLSEELQLERVR